MNVIKVNINGKEFLIKDTEAQKQIEALTKRVEAVESKSGLYIIEVD